LLGLLNQIEAVAQSGAWSLHSVSLAQVQKPFELVSVTHVLPQPDPTQDRVGPPGVVQ